MKVCIGKTVLAIGAVAVAASLAGCSQESRDEAIDRLQQAGKALNGEVRPDDKEHATPNIVAEEQRKIVVLREKLQAVLSDLQMARSSMARTE